MSTKALYGSNYTQIITSLLQAKLCKNKLHYMDK